ncbi:MAG: mechanosensitive ion channel family protein [Gammaproteobacteria bacterium]
MLDETQSIIESSVAFLGDNHSLAAVLIVFASFVVAWLMNRYLIALLEKLASKTRGYLDDRLIGDLRRPLFSTVLILGFASATVVLRLSEGVQSTISSVLQMLAVLVWTLFALKLIPVLLRRLAERDRTPAVVNAQTVPLFQNIANMTVLVLSVYYIFSSWHVDMTAWLASAGIVGIAVAFAAKDTLANLFSGMLILADRPYEIGNFVVLGTGERGEVTHIGMRSTRLLTRDDVEITVPNSIMGNTTIVNESGGPHEKFRIRVQVSVAYGADIDEVREALLSVAAREESVCDEPEPRVRFRRFGASGLDFELLCWINEPVLSGRVVDILNSSVYKLFQASGIEIPYAKQDIYVKEMPLR